MIPQRQTQKIFIGIDNGTSGAMVALYPGGRIISQMSFVTETGSRKMLDVDKSIEWICSVGNRQSLFIAFEQSQIQPVFGAVNNYINGQNNEFWRVLLTLQSVAFIAVNPRTWQKVIFAGVRGSTKKGQSKKTAAYVIRQRFPDFALSDSSAKEREAINDALCIALWAKQTQA